MGGDNGEITADRLILTTQNDVANDVEIAADAATPGTQIVDGLASIIQVGGIELIRIIGAVGRRTGLGR